jgi:ribosomal protein S4
MNQNLNKQQKTRDLSSNTELQERNNKQEERNNKQEERNNKQEERNNKQEERNNKLRKYLHDVIIKQNPEINILSSIEEKKIMEIIDDTIKHIKEDKNKLIIDCINKNILNKSYSLDDWLDSLNI